MKLINRLHFEFDGYTFDTELPFKPEEGDYVIISGINKDGVTKEVVSKIYGLIYHSVKGHWIMNPSLIDWHTKQKENTENTKDPLGLGL